MQTRSFSLVAAAPALALSIAACQPAPGDYRVYRVAFQETVSEADCFDGNPPPNDSVNTLFGVSSIALFAADADTYFLEFADLGLTGTRDGGDYAFAGEQTQVQDFGEFNATDSSVWTISLTIENKQIRGEIVTVDSGVCSGSEGDCAMFGVGNYKCTARGKFFGSEINSVDLEYNVNGGGGGGGDI